jgi:hypothetical protein
MNFNEIIKKKEVYFALTVLINSQYVGIVHGTYYKYYYRVKFSI